MGYAIQRVEQPGKHSDTDVRELETVGTFRRNHGPSFHRSAENRGKSRENWRTRTISRSIEALWLCKRLNGKHRVSSSRRLTLCVSTKLAADENYRSHSRITGAWERGVPCQRGFLVAAGGVGAVEWSSHAGIWILELVTAPPLAAHSLKGLFQPR
jgi:hypothetical protein